MSNSRVFNSNIAIFVHKAKSQAKKKMSWISFRLQNVCTFILIKYVEQITKVRWLFIYFDMHSGLSVLLGTRGALCYVRIHNENQLKAET